MSSPTHRGLLHWPFLLALGVLILNDHLLKGADMLPGWVTGKLTDLAGLYAAPITLAALLGVESRAGHSLSAAAVGCGFSALQLSQRSCLCARP